MAEIIIIQGSRHVVWECRNCGCVSTCPEQVFEEHHAEGGFHHCPNGHQWGWTKEISEREQLRRERDQLKQKIAERNDEVGRQIEMRKKIEGKLGRITKRINHGVCPCCNRTFDNLARHMKSKHPNIVPLAKDRAS
jgi:hypothetical protein